MPHDVHPFPTVHEQFPLSDGSVIVASRESAEPLSERSRQAIIAVGEAASALLRSELGDEQAARLRSLRRAADPNRPTATEMKAEISKRAATRGR